MHAAQAKADTHLVVFCFSPEHKAILPQAVASAGSPGRLLKNSVQAGFGKARFQSRHEGLYYQPLFNRLRLAFSNKDWFLGTLPEPALSAVEGSRRG
jgi:hypothetical protein